MSIITTETEWQKVIGNPRLTRSLFAPTDVASLYVTDGRNYAFTVIDETPYQEFELKPWTFSYRIDNKRWKIWLRLIGTGNHGLQSADYQVLWKSFYQRSPSVWKYTYRATAIFVLVPSPKPGISQIKIDLTRWPKKTILSLDSQMRAKKTSGLKSTKNGFSGQGSSPPGKYPVANYHTVQDWAWSFQGTPGAPTSDPYEVEDYYKNIVSVNTPNFGSVHRKNLPVNPYKCTVRYSDDSPGFVSALVPPTGNYNRLYYGKSSVTFFPARSGPGFPSDLKNKALEKLMKRANADISANLAQDFVQFRQLRDLVTGTIGRIIKANKLIREKNDVRGALKALGSPGGKKISLHKGAAKNWLEIQYAWKILLKEIEDLMQMISDSSKSHPPVRMVSSSSKRTDLESSRYLFRTGWPESYIEVVTKYRVKVGCYYTMEDQLRAYVQQLGFTNPINLAYEVIPYSFVADWFIPIGPYLSSLSAWEGMAFKGGFVTQYARQEMNCYAYEGTIEHDVENTCGARWNRVWVEIEREKLNSFPQLSFPKPKNPVSLTHALNAIALITVAFSNK